MGINYETLLGRLGSRFTLNFRPREQRIYLSPMGRFYDVPLSLSLGIMMDGKEYCLPFSEKGPQTEFLPVSQELSLDGIRFHLKEPKLGIEFNCKVHAPFYPEDRIISGAPFFYIDLEIKSFLHGRSSFSPLSGEWFLRVGGVEGCHTAGGEVVIPIVSQLVSDCWYNTHECPPEAKSAFTEGKFEGVVKISPAFPEDAWEEAGSLMEQGICLRKCFHLDSQDTVLQESLIIAGYQPGTVFKVEGRECEFFYTSWFSDVDSVISYARRERETLLAKTKIFLDTIEGATLGKGLKNILAVGFQNYLSNTWWVREKEAEQDWFTVWEGWCAFHSTLDVEYNNSWFPLLYWPELLEKQLSMWYAKARPEGYFPHDLGILLEMNDQVYPHNMEVEESCNLLLLVYAFWKLRGYRGWLQQMPVLQGAVRYLLSSDTTGNGYPNLGVANTIDDGGATTQYAKEQTYLGMKVFSALTAFAELAREYGDDQPEISSLLQESALMRQRFQKTLEEQAWRGDHYAICLPQTAKGLRDVWTGREVKEDELKGWEAYSIYTANGLLYLLATGVNPALDWQRIKEDIVSACRQSLTPYGCTHSSFDVSNVWISQNMWRDMIAAYLGIDLIDLTQNYNRFLEMENVQGRGGCFVDTYGWNWLSYYPRGVTAFGYLPALAGLKVDYEKKTAIVSPVRFPCRIPLVLLADWKSGSVPVLNCRIKEAKVSWEIERAPEDWQISFALNNEVKSGINI